LDEVDGDGDGRVLDDSNWVEVAMSEHGHNSTSWKEERQSKMIQRKMSRWKRLIEHGEVYSQLFAGSPWLINWLEDKVS